MVYTMLNIMRRTFNKFLSFFANFFSISNMNGPQTITKTKTRTKTVIGWALVGGAIMAAGGFGYEQWRSGTTDTTLPKPDLTVLSHTGSPEPLYTGQAITLTASAWNQGLATALGTGIIFRIQNVTDHENPVDVTSYTTTVESLTISNGRAIITPPSDQWTVYGSWSATPGSYTALACIDYGSTVDESNEDNNCMGYRFEVTDPQPTPQPDLIVEAISTAAPFSATIKNIGQAGAAPATHRLEWYDKDTAKIGASVTLQSAALEAGISQTILITPPDNTKSILVVANWPLTVVESNTGNNSLWVSLPDPPPPPSDLTVLSLTRSPSSLTAGASVVFTATIKNQGDGPAGAFDVNCKIDVGNDGQVGNNPPPTVLSVSSLDASATTTLDCPASWTTTAGTHKAIVTVDSAFSIAESNENNNGKNLVFTVAAPAQPDLTIQSFNCTPQNPTAGATVTCTAGVKNQGNMQAGASTTQFRIDLGVTLTHDQVTAALNVNSTAFKTLSWTATQGTHTFDVCADIANVVVESSIGETNNCSSPITVNVAAAPAASAPDLAVVQPIVYDPLYKKFTVTVVNQGTANTSSATLRFRIDKYKDGSWDFNPVTKSLGALTPNAVSDPQQWTWNVNFPGTHKAEACLTTISPTDPNSANNCQTLEFTM